jgi:epoxyqueuosine reductase
LKTGSKTDITPRWSTSLQTAAAAAAPTRSKSSLNANPFWCWRPPTHRSQKTKLNSKSPHTLSATTITMSSPPRLQEIVSFIEEQIGHPIPNRYYTDTGPILERELAQRAGLGWIGKNSMLINPQAGSTFLLAEILLGIELEPDEPFPTDHCGTCTRCIDACPTHCILPNRTLNANRCISFLTIENKGDIPEDLRLPMQNWIFGCDICQQVCPWNRFSQPADPALETKIPLPIQTSDLLLLSSEFNQRFKKSPITRAKRRGYVRNLAVVIGNTGNADDIPILEQAAQDDEPLIREHAKWAIKQVNSRSGFQPDSTKE